MKQKFIMLATAMAALFAATYATPAQSASTGVVPLPYHEDFETEDNLGLIDIVDANNDGRTWVWSDIVFDMRNKASEETVADDWMILPPMEMKADKSYRLTFNARAVYSMYPERLEVKLGKGTTPSPESMTITLMPPTELIKRRDVGITITVPEDGIYRIGFHAVSDAGAFRLAVDDINVDSPQSALRPGVPTECKAERINEGELKAKVTFTAPSLTVNGKSLSAMDKAEIFVNSTLASTIESPTPGTPYSREVTTSQGVNSIKIVATNSEGEGEPVEIDLFTGDDTPMPPTNLRMEVKDGKAYLKWDAPTEGENGGYINPETLTYEIQRRSDFEYVEKAYAGTEYVDELPANINSRPRQLWYCVRAISNGGKSLDSADSNRFITGDSMQLPFTESFADVNYDDDHYWHSINDGERWNLTGSLVYDNDGGAAKFAPANMGENSLFYTSRIDLRGNTNPLLTFHYWHVKNSDMILQIMVSRENGEFETVRTLDFSADNSPAGWKKCAVLLDKFTDSEYVLIGWKGIAGGIQTVTAIDAIDLRDVPSADLAVSLSAPEKAAENQPIRIEVAVTNIGATDAASFKVQLKHEGLGTVIEQEGKDLGAGMSQVFEFNLPFQCTPGITNGSYVASVTWDDDINFDNDTDRKVVLLRAGRLPKPEGLKGEKSEGIVMLSWNTPALEGAITDDIEDYEPFVISDFGDWITIDRDRHDTYRIIEPELDEDGEQLGYVTLDYPNAGMPMAFQVFNPFEAKSSYANGMCRSGKQVLSSFAAIRDRNDDWLISPELSGEAQTISFWARSGGSESFGQEKLEVYASDKLQEPENFGIVLTETSIPNNDWVEITATLPESTKHFAIHCISEIVMALFIDDITYTPKPANAELLGYNVYRDKVKLNGDLLTSASYIDRQGNESAEYHVTAVYKEGESKPAKILTADMGSSAIESLIPDSYRFHISQGRLDINTDEVLNVEVYSLQGTRIAEKQGQGTLSFNLDKGLYIISINGKAFKAIVP